MSNSKDIHKDPLLGLPILEPTSMPSDGETNISDNIHSNEDPSNAKIAESFQDSATLSLAGQGCLGGTYVNTCNEASNQSEQKVLKIVADDDKSSQKNSQEEFGESSIAASNTTWYSEDFVSIYDKHGSDSGDTDSNHGNEENIYVDTSKIFIPKSPVKKSSDSKTIVRSEDKEESLESPLAVNMAAELSDVGKFSYAAMCGASLHHMYGSSVYNKKYFTGVIKSLVEHLEMSDKVATSILTIVDGVGMNSCDPLVESLLEEEVVKKHGPQVICYDLVTLSLKQGCYDSRIRALIKKIAFLQRVKWDKMAHYEELVVQVLTEEEHEMTDDEKKEKESQRKKRSAKRYALIGLATVSGGVLLGLTGGLAAPVIAATAGALIGGASATVLGSAAGILIIGSLFGVAGAGLGGYKMNKRVGGIDEFAFDRLSEGRSLHVTIAVTGWLSEDMPDFRTPWLGLNNSKEQYSLAYESKHLIDLGRSIDTILKCVGKMAATEMLKMTVLSGIIGAIAWPATIIAMAGVIDNPWNVCTQRATNAGLHLAEVLLSRQQGKRPVTLVGFSMGARLIFSCLKELASRKNSEGLVEDVIIMGAPVTADPEEWKPFARVVAGNIINGYCRTDWLLKFVYRTASAQSSIAGVEPVLWDDRRMHNIDLTDTIDGHLDYMYKIDYILDLLGVPTRPHVMPVINVAEDSLRQWVDVQKSGSMSVIGVEAWQSETDGKSRDVKEQLNLDRAEKRKSKFFWEEGDDTDEEFETSLANPVKSSSISDNRVILPCEDDNTEGTNTSRTDELILNKAAASLFNVSSANSQVEDVHSKPPLLSNQKRMALYLKQVSQDESTLEDKLGISANLPVQSQIGTSPTVKCPLYSSPTVDAQFHINPTVGNHSISTVDNIFTEYSSPYECEFTQSGDSWQELVIMLNKWEEKHFEEIIHDKQHIMQQCSSDHKIYI